MPGTQLLVTDLQASVLASVGQTPRSYSPYGAHMPNGGALLAFAGQAADPVTGCYHLGNGRRTYNPVLMRFQSPDSLSPFDRGGINAYAYCGGDPINRVDPSGETSLLSKFVSAISMFSSGVTMTGAIARTANDVIKRIASELRRTPYVAPSTRTRMGNVAFFYTGGAGISGAVLNGAEQGWMGNVLTSAGSKAGITGAIGNIAGGALSNSQAIGEVWAGLRQPGISTFRVARETAYEVTGVGLLVDASSYLARQGSELTARIRWTWDAWRNWRAPSAPPLEIEMAQIRDQSS